jgi:murein DD-endopeptidase MepM/ murein hydrolase activator NlpD
MTSGMVEWIGGWRVARLAYLLAILVALASLPHASCGAKKSALSTKIKQAKKIRADIDRYRYKIRVKEQEKRSVIGRLSEIESRLVEAQDSLTRNKIRLLDAQADLKATIERLERTRKQLARRRALFGRRIVDIYEGEDLNYVNVVLGATDMWTFLTRAYYLQRILDSDTTLIRQIRADEEAIERDKARQQKRVGEIQGLQVRLEAERNQVASLAEDKRSQLAAIENSKELMEQALDALLAKSQEIEDQIRAIQNTPRGQARYARAFRGGLRMPVGGRITSRFGYRVHPITGVYKLHTGVDIACPTGSSICAAADGVVILAGWMGAYGYAVVIDHGGGVSTLYGHNSRLLVGVGDKVKQGQTIARAGSTGYSTGPHCHFEKRVNGTPVNPL